MEPTIVHANGAELCVQTFGAPTDPAESSKVEWVPVDDVRVLLRSGAVTDGLSLTALLWWMAFVDG